MAYVDLPLVESDALDQFAQLLTLPAACRAHSSAPALGPVQKTGRLNLDQDKLKNGLGQLVLTLVKVLHELLEKQAIHRIEAGSLTDDDIERMGLTLMQQAEEIDRLRRAFNLEDDDLNLDLGPLGRLL
jgi:hypothetical protein